MIDPQDHLLAWAAEVTAPGSRVVHVTGLRGGGNPWLLRLDRAGQTQTVVLKTADPASNLQIRGLITALAAMTLLQDHDFPAPRPIAADLTGAAAGQLAVIMTTLPGSSQIPRNADPGRLRELGAMAAAIHAVPMAARTDLSPALSPRTRPLYDMDFAAWRRSTSTTPLLERAEEAIASLPAPGDPATMIHGDLWQGNTLWSDGTCSGIIDWDCAGAGAPGIDLGTLRLDAALYHGVPAAQEILLGWQQAAGRAPDDLAYWDLVAALTTVGDMADCLPPLSDHGREDLSAPTLTRRRDAFLQAALDRLAHVA